ncbi:conserved hypothetical protein [Talaromyces stipitatus ATCC 10500]|uniref:Xylanolytic transcriptional activator regulatory domain-containing protein n=1 Tax=Talaromyces stipitatus (strain ATCC 10500 / CBS 375.48 / QM 6759 / NRRL 1006) TaxID=441959 RepID=B8MKV3_TALSN|nr:uncharacterized protein TSTA_044190 [Talaromyces stipitatus ATCC 10500]EED14952.1 conserved hypothetical protein [Talaromyces stipitatus ATCC 10500]
MDITTPLEPSDSFPINSPPESHSFLCENELLSLQSTELNTSSLINMPHGQFSITDGLHPSALLPETQQLLISLYFDHIQPSFPLFRKPVFYADLIANNIPDMLLAAMFAVSSRFLPSRQVCKLFGDNSQPWDDFSRIAQQAYQDEILKNDPVPLTVVKVACLLALYESTKAPSRQGWLLVNNAVRLALMAQLHQIDTRDFPVTVSAAEKEEWRFVWWTVWRLDCTLNVTACAPFGIDEQMIGTALVSTTVEDFTCNIVQTTTFPSIPEMDPVKFWTSPGGPQVCDAGDGFNIHLFATSLLRAVSECQQRLNIKPTVEDIKRVAALVDILASLHLILPDWFFEPSRRDTESVYCHRIRLEIIIMLNTARLIVHEPLRQLIQAMDLSPNQNSHTVSLESWCDSISFAEAIARVLDSWPSAYFAISDPIITCAIWHAYCAMTLYSMSGLESSTSDARTQTSLESLRISLERFTTYWPIARVLQGSLQEFRAWSWATLDVRRIVLLIHHIRTALSPFASDPGKVDVKLICDSVL